MPIGPFLSQREYIPLIGNRKGTFASKLRRTLDKKPGKQDSLAIRSLHACQLDSISVL